MRNAEYRTRNILSPSFRISSFRLFGGDLQSFELESSPDFFPKISVEATSMGMENFEFVIALEAISINIDRMSKFGYDLYLRTKATSWSQPHFILVSGSGPRFGDGEKTVQYTRSWHWGCSLHCNKEGTKRLIFGMMLAWNKEFWILQSNVELEQDEEDEFGSLTRELWSSPKLTGVTVYELELALNTAFPELEDSVNTESVSAALHLIEPRRF
jgi:hypothetical protein